MMHCPACDAVLMLEKVALADETMTMEITWEGEMVEAKTIGGIIENTRKLLMATAKEGGCAVDVFMRSIEWEHNKARFNFAVILRKERHENYS